MTEDYFNELVAKVLAGEATSAEELELRTLIQSDPHLKNEFESLQYAWDVVRELSPITEAMSAPPSEIPADKLAVLKERIRFQKTTSSNQERDKSFWFERLIRTAWDFLRLRPGFALLLFSALIAIVATVTVSKFSRGDLKQGQTKSLVSYVVMKAGEAKLVRERKVYKVSAVQSLQITDQLQVPKGAQVSIVSTSGVSEVNGPSELKWPFALEAASTISGFDPSVEQKLHATLFATSRKIKTSDLLSVTREPGPIPLYSPLDSTSKFKPDIRWKSEAGKKYDLELRENADSGQLLLMVTGLVSWVELPNIPDFQKMRLDPNNVYRIILRESANPFSASQYSFRTLNELSQTTEKRSPGAELLRAFQLLTADPPRTGDAMEILFQLAPPFADSELALRLKLFVYGVHGYQEDFEKTLQELDLNQAVKR